MKKWIAFAENSFGVNDKMNLEFPGLRGVRYVNLYKGQGGLGMCDLCSFNIALLAKQGWRILTRPYSLMSRILKAKYFPNVSFWDTKIQSNASYTWRSILADRDILKHGVDQLENRQR